MPQKTCKMQKHRLEERFCLEGRFFSTYSSFPHKVISGAAVSFNPKYKAAPPEAACMPECSGRYAVDTIISLCCQPFLLKMDSSVVVKPNLTLSETDGYHEFSLPKLRVRCTASRSKAAPYRQLKTANRRRTRGFERSEKTSPTKTARKMFYFEQCSRKAEVRRKD